MNRFPIFRLPFVALQEVILSIEKSDLFNLALSGRKMCRLVNLTKNPVSIQKLPQEAINKLNAKDKLNIALLEDLENSSQIVKRLEFIVSEQLTFHFLFHYFFEGNSRLLNFRFHIYSFDEKIQGKEEIMKFGGVEVPVVIDSSGNIFTLWEDIDFGSQLLSSHFFQQFKFNQVSLDVNPADKDGCKFSRSLKNAVAILKTPLEKTPFLWVQNIKFMPDSDFLLLFQNIKYNDIAMVGPTNGRFPDNFECEAEGLDVAIATGFSLKNLLNSKCNNIALRRKTHMTNKVMTKVLTHWLDGKLEKLKALEIELMELVNVELVLSGLSERTGYVMNRTEDSISITREDGKRAVIPIPGRTKTFKMDILEKINNTNQRKHN